MVINMNIRFDQNNENIVKESGVYDRTAQINHRDNMQGKSVAENMGFGYSVQLQGMKQDGNAYAENEVVAKSAQELLGDNGLSTIDIQKNYMIVMSNTVSDEELAKIQEEGYKPGEMTPEEIVTIVDEIKGKLAAAGTVIAGYNDDLDIETLEQMTGSKVNAQAIKTAMRQYDLPLTEKNVQEMQKAIALGQDISELSDGGKKYLLENHLEPTLENLYLAAHSGASQNSMQATGYFSEGMGYFGKKPDSVDMEGLGQQIGQIISGAGYEVNDENKELAGKMIQQGLTLTEDSYEKMKRLQQMKFPMELDELAQISARALKDGKRGIDGIPGMQETYEQQAYEIIMKAEAITEAAVVKTIEEGKEINLRSLSRAQREIELSQQIISNERNVAMEEVQGNKALNNQSVDSVSSTRQATTMVQLQEIRLQMTVSVGAYLLRNGIQVDTRELGLLVDDLKFAVAQKNEILFQQGSVEGNEKAAEIFEQSDKVLKDLPNMPAALVGSISVRSSFTLNIAYEQGASMRLAYEAAGEKYETLMTAPRADLGDSIRTAFRSVDTLLEENGIAVNEENAKAVRILGYNQMEITAESVAKVRNAYEKLNGVIEKMTPAATLALIRDKKNPLEMNMEDLEKYLSERDASGENSAEKYSSFLVRMQESKKMTAEEQESYIGIYRMLHQIERRDSAAVGAVLNGNQEITFRNLLTSVQSKAWAGKEFGIDDKFGALDQIITKGTSITDQLNKAFDTDSSNRIDSKADEMIENNLRELATQNSEGMNLLATTNISFTTDHILAANHLLQNRGGMFRVASGKAEGEVNKSATNQENRLSVNSQEIEASENELFDVAENTSDLVNAFTDEQSAKSAYETMADRLQNALEVLTEQTTNRLDLRNLSVSMKQISLARQMAREECFEIPMQLGEEITSVNVKLVHSRDEMGKVSIYSESKMYGKMQASFEFSKQGIQGYVVGSDSASLKQLEAKKESFYQSMVQVTEEKIQLSFIQSDRFQVNYLTSSADDNNREIQRESESANSQERIPTKTLYETAKAFLVLLNS